MKSNDKTKILFKKQEQEVISLNIQIEKMEEIRTNQSS